MANGKWASTAGLIFLLAAAYVVLGRLTFAVSVEYGNVTSVVFAPEGVALAMCILFGPRVAPGILIGQTVLSYWSGPSVLGGAVIGLFNTAEGMLGWYLFQRWGLSRSFSRPRDVGLFVAMVFLVLQPISATGGVSTLYALGAIPTDWLPADWAPWWIQGMQKPLSSPGLVQTAWTHWWVGNSVGQLLVAPLILAWTAARAGTTPRKGHGDLLAADAGVLLVMLLSLVRLPIHPLLMLAVIYPGLVWIGLRRGIRGVTTANLLIAPAIIWAGATGEGFLGSLSVPDRLAYVSFVIATAGVFSLMLCAMFEERRVMIEQLTELASTDPLVPLSNRRHFIECAERELVRSDRQGHALSLLMLDVDHFKRVNDQYGHAVGDLALKAVAGHCARVARRGDLTGRLGGEEFSLLLPETGLDGARVSAERLREAIEVSALRLEDGRVLRLTASVGVAQRAPGMRLDAMLEAADAQLYRAKQSGRNRVCVAPAADAVQAERRSA